MVSYDLVCISSTNVFANAFISVTYVLNGRKVTAKLLKRLEKIKI